MSVEPTSAPPATCPTCGASLARGEMCPRCLFGDVLAVLDGPVPPKGMPLPDGTPARKTVGEYDLIEELGRGGMGIVWKAKHRRLNRTVALKLVRGGCLPGEAAAKRFRREAEAAAQLRHPNIVGIHEVGEYDDQLFLSMDWVSGGSLADWLKRVAFSPREAATLVAKVARGVHHAHEMLVLHRDLKPGNILLDPTGEPKVCDFGLARIGQEDSSLTMSGELIGTPAYLSPEQAAGKMKDLTPASDTYSLGAILYELLCGHPPFSADTLPALLRKVAEDDPMRPISHYSGGRIPFDLSTICLKCLEKEPPARYATSLALAEDLERWLRGEPIEARPVARVERVWKWVRRKPVLAALWFGITLMMVVVAVIASVMSIRLERQRQKVAGLAEASRHQVARQMSDSAQRYISDGDFLRALPTLAEAIRIGTGDPRLNEADRIRFGVLLRCSPKLRQAWYRGEPITRAETTSDGSRLLVASDKSLEVWSIASAKRIGEPLLTEGEISNAQFDSVTGRWVLLEIGNKLTIWEPDSGVKRDLGPGHIFTPPDSYMQRGPNFASYDGKTASVRSVATGERIAGPMQHQAAVTWAVMIHDLNRVMTADIEGSIYFWDATTGDAKGNPIRLRAASRPVNFDAYDPRQKRAALHRDRDCWLIDCENGTVATELRDADDSPQTLGWDEEGVPLYLARNNDGVTLRYMENDTIRWAWSHRGLGFRGSFAFTAGMVATQSWNGSARVWRISSGRPVSPYLWQTATPGSCILDPNGRWLLTRGDEPAARLWELRDEEDVSAFPAVLEKPVDAWIAEGPERMFVAEQDGTVTAWRTELPRRKSGEVRHPESALVHAVPTARAKRFLTAGKKVAQMWNAETFVAEGKPCRIDTSFVQVAPDALGERLAAVLPDGNVAVYDVATGAVKVAFQAGARQVSFSSDGRLILVVGEKSVHTWDAATGQPVSSPVEQPGGMAKAKFSPDGRSVVQWCARQSTGQTHAQIWDATTGKIQTQLQPHWQGITDIVWTPDGSQLATAGVDQTLLLSDAKSGALVIPPIKHMQKVSAVGFSKDGMLMWTLADKDITVWSAISGEPLTPQLRQIRFPTAITMCGDDGRNLAVVAPRAAPRVWNLQPDLRSPDELRSIALALSSHAVVDGTSALRPLTLVEMRSAWESARKALNAW